MDATERSGSGRWSTWVSCLNVLLLLAIVTIPGVAMGGARTWAILPVYGLVAALIVLQAARMAFRSFGQPLRVDVADAFAGLFLFYAALRYATAPGEYEGRLELLNIASYATVFWVARYGLARAGYGVFFLVGFVALATGVAGFSFWLHLHPEFHPYGEVLHLYYAPRLTGTFGCPNHYGSFLYMGVAAALGIGLFAQRQWVGRMLVFYAAALMIVGIGLSISRGSWIGLFMVLLAVTVFCVRHGGLRWYWPVGALVLLAAAGVAGVFFIPGALDRIAEVQQNFANGTVHRYIRIQIAQDAWKIIQDHFWFGTGPATFLHMHPRYEDSTFNSLAVYTHDDYLNLWSDYGLTGVLLALGFIVSVSVGLARRIDFRAPWTHRVLLCAAVGAWAGLLVHSFLDFSLHIPACALALFTLTGLGLRRREGAPDVSGVRRRALALGSATAVLVAGLIFAAGALKTARGYYPYREVQQQGTTMPYDVAVPLLQRATEADPNFPDAEVLLGDYYRTEAGRRTDRAERVEPGLKAIRAYQHALRASPLDDGIYIHLGLAYDTLQRYDEAYLSYQRAIGFQPYNGYFKTALGLHFWRRGMNDRAVTTFQQAMKCPYGREAAAGYLNTLSQPAPH